MNRARPMAARLIIGWGFCDIRNNQGQGQVQPKSKTEADNTNRDLDYFGYNKTESNNCFILHCFKGNNDKRIVTPNTVYFQQAMFLLRCPWTWHCSWKSCIALFPRSNCRLLANEKTDDVYNV